MQQYLNSHSIFIGRMVQFLNQFSHYLAEISLIDMTQSAQTNALIVLAHGSTDPDWRAPFERLVNTLGLPHIRLAYMEMAQPDLMTVAQQLMTDMPQLTRLDVLPLFMAQGGHLRHDVPNQLTQLQRQYSQIECTLLPPVGQHPLVTQAMLTVCQQWCDTHANTPV
jgi:sirohydrochlorin cobaltochelatase